MQAAVSMASARSQTVAMKSSASVGRQQARGGAQERLGRVDRSEALALDAAQRDLASIEPAQGQAQLQAGGEEGDVVFRSGVHRGCVLRAGPTGGPVMTDRSQPAIAVRWTER